MIYRWNRQALGAVMGVALVAFLTVGLGQALADPILVHQSREDFYSTGGTLISGCLGEGCTASTFSFGNISGTPQWEVVEKVFRDTVTGTTQFAYTLFNDALSPNISSFHIANNGVSGVGTAPTGWAFTQDESYWSWQTLTPLVTGVAQTGSLGGYSVNLSGNVPVIFNLTKITLSDGLTTVGLNSNQWMASAPGAPVPEPASLLLLGSGLAGLGAWRRRSKDRSL